MLVFLDKKSYNFKIMRNCTKDNEQVLNPLLRKQLEDSGADIPKILQFLNDLESKKFTPAVIPENCTVPDLSHPSIIDRRKYPLVSLAKLSLEKLLEELNLDVSVEEISQPAGCSVVYLGYEELKRFGIMLYEKTAYGILNGGSATSYADYKKNEIYCSSYFNKHLKKIEEMAELCKGKPKGITPAYLCENGTPGESFMLLKFRMLLLKKQEYFNLMGKLPETLLPAFQMTSVQTHDALLSEYKEYEKNPLLTLISSKIGAKPIDIVTGMQPLMAALTPASDGLPRRVFDKAYGEENRGIPLPGGHGQNFAVLKDIYQDLYDKGIRYFWLGNVDNIGYTVDPISLALFALSGRDGAFETSVKTPLDTKGGILIQQPSGHLNCADIGSGITKSQVDDFEVQGKTLLFNCGLGLFNLKKLLPRLDSIPYELPLRITEQDKDAGRYAQAEQNTWEIIGLLQRPLFFAVEKRRRFVAAKLLLETMLSSTSKEELEASGVQGKLLEAATTVGSGLIELLSSEYGL